MRLKKAIEQKLWDVRLNRKNHDRCEEFEDCYGIDAMRDGMIMALEWVLGQNFDKETGDKID